MSFTKELFKEVKSKFFTKRNIQVILYGTIAMLFIEGVYTLNTTMDITTTQLNVAYTKISIFMFATLHIITRVLYKNDKDNIFNFFHNWISKNEVLSEIIAGVLVIIWAFITMWLDKIILGYLLLHYFVWYGLIILVSISTILSTVLFFVERYQNKNDNELQ